MQDYGALLRTHRENNADITIATHAVGKKQAYLRGITKVEPDTGPAPSFLCISATALHAAVQSCMLRLASGIEHSLITKDCLDYFVVVDAFIIHAASE